MNRLQTKMQPGEGWMAPGAAAVVYGLSNRELLALVEQLKEEGRSCPKKGLEIRALDRAVAELRRQG
jgi:hypothetical protein